MEQAPLLPWAFAFLNATELQRMLRVGPLRAERHQELWYYVCQTVRRAYPFLPPLQLHQDGWEVTYWREQRRMGAYLPHALAALRQGLLQTGLPPVAVAARKFVRCYRPPHETREWDAQLLLATGCVVCGLPASAPRRGAAMERALAEGADPDATLGVQTPYLARVSDMDKPPLYFALCANALDLVQQLLTAGASVEGTLRAHARTLLLRDPQCVAALALVASGTA